MERFASWVRLCWLAGVCLSAAWAAVFWRAPLPAFADGVVTNCADDTQFSSFLPLGGTITFSCGGPVTLTVASTKVITTAVTIEGANGGYPLVLSGNNLRRIFSVNSGVTLNLYDLTVTNGRSALNNGGNIFNSGTLNLTSVTIANGHASTSINGSAGNGGGIFNAAGGTLNIAQSSIISNTAQGGTSAGGAGGGIDNAGTVTIVNSTISGNNADLGGGLSTSGSGANSLLNVTFAHNASSTDGDDLSAAGTLTVKNAILAGPVINGLCSASTAFSSQGHNLSTDTSCASLTAGGDQPNTPVGLGPLANNGGPTLTHLPQGGSAAINTGDNSGCPSTDQRGVTRPQGGTCDIGAVEAAYPASVGGFNPVSHPAGTAGFALTVYGSNFMNGSVVYWNGMARSTAYVSSSQLTASILASDVAMTGTATVTVLNPTAAMSTGASFSIFEGSDTVSDCSEYGLDAALFNGGNITFTCGPATIAVSAQKTASHPTSIDGGGQITLTSVSASGIFSVPAGVSFGVANLTLSNGDAQTNCLDGGAIHNAGTLSVSGVTFAVNKACSGGAIWNSNTASIAGSTFRSNTARQGGAIYNSGTLSVSLGTFISNTNVLNGGAIYNGGALTVTNSQFSANRATTVNGSEGGNGGAIANDGTAVVSGGVFSANGVIGEGGALWNTQSMTVISATLSGNSAYPFFVCCIAGVGGAIANYGSLSVLDTTLLYNVAERGAGGIMNKGSLTLTGGALISNTANNWSGGGFMNYGGATLRGVRFTLNAAATYEGGAVGNEGTLIIYTSTFTNNVALSGGALRSSSPFTLSGSLLSGNQATASSGGALHTASGTGYITATTFLSNTAAAGGGAVLNDADLVITHGTFTGNSAPSGGALLNNFRLTLTDSALSANSAAGGAGISNTAVLSVSADVLSLNIASDHGGAIDNAGSLAVLNSTFSANGAGSFGGAIDNAGSATLTGSTFSANSAGSSGGGLDNTGGITATNSTFSANGAGSFGGAIAQRSASQTVVLLNSTFFSNTASLGGGSLYRDGAAIALQNTIVAFSTPQNCAGTQGLVTQGHNLESANSCNLTAGSDHPNTDPKLGPLANNGGPTLTHALLSGSPAINAGGNSGCPSRDQRGVPRPQGGICDIGAYEFAFPYSLFLPQIMR